jgi:hypothetical protein
MKELLRFELLVPPSGSGGMEEMDSNGGGEKATAVFGRTPGSWTAELRLLL